jgi:hypothetical protein
MVLFITTAVRTSNPTRTSLLLQYTWQNYESQIIVFTCIYILVLSDVTPCSLVVRYQCVLKEPIASFPEDGGSRLLQNAGTYPPNYTASHPRRPAL